jgi:hypothetical protein
MMVILDNKVVDKEIIIGKKEDRGRGEAAPLLKKSCSGGRLEESSYLAADF